MKLLATFTDKDIGEKEDASAKCEPRVAARAVILDGNLIPLLHVTKDNYYKLPGGGIDGDESVSDALIREVLEEAGCTITVVAELGEIVEHRTKGKMLHTSYCFLAKLVKKGKPNLTEEEIREGFELVWVTLDDALMLVKNSTPQSYNGKFIVKRDLLFLEKAKELIKK